MSFLHVTEHFYVFVTIGFNAGTPRFMALHFIARCRDCVLVLQVEGLRQPCIQ